MTKLDFSWGFGGVWELIRVANSYIEDRQPWALDKAGDATATAEVLGDCLEALRIVALLASPLIPNAAAELWRRLGLAGRPKTRGLPKPPAGGGLPAGARLEKGAPLFPRLETCVTWVDSHCHLQSLSDPGGAIERAAGGRRPAGMVCVGTDLETSRQAIELAARSSGRACNGRPASARRNEVGRRMGAARSARRIR